MDKRLRELERRATETGAPNDLETLMTEHERAGNGVAAATIGRQLLETNIEHAGAREAVARYAPLLWTGTVSVQKEPGTDNLDEPTLVCREGNTEYSVDITPLKTERGSELHIAYAGNTLALFHTRHHPTSTVVNERMDITPLGKQPFVRTLRPDAVHADHNQGQITAYTLSSHPDYSQHPWNSFALNSAEHSQIRTNAHPPHSISRLVRGVSEQNLGSAGQSPWIHEDGRIAFSDFNTTDFLDGEARSRGRSYSYERTRIPAWSRLHRGINSAATEGNLANVYDGLKRIVVEVPITILNALRRMNVS